MGQKVFRGQFQFLIYQLTLMKNHAVQVDRVVLRKVKVSKTIIMTKWPNNSNSIDLAWTLAIVKLMIISRGKVRHSLICCRVSQYLSLIISRTNLQSLRMQNSKDLLSIILMIYYRILQLIYSTLIKDRKFSD
jgi:hypothetical protein